FFSIAAGVLIIISSVFATRFARIQEAVYYKVLGAKGRFVLQVFTLENLILGLTSAVVALILSHIAGWILAFWVFEIPYRPFVGASLLMVILTIMLVIAVGMVASISILQKRPIVFLREQNES
ncbi:MAG: FtsX-like permease family protein, partial [Chloroflexota bacterium]